MSQISVADYYAGKSIFITGATGFMGKVLVEKLLRCCPELKTMYLMVRKKKGKNAESRLDALKESRAFEKLLEQNPKAFNKVKLICGDTLKEGLGMSISDVEELERECQIVFNNAACVKFDLPLREAVKLNTIGLQRILKLAEGMKKLEAFVHISTAFCHDELEVLDEKMYPSKHNPLDVIHSLQWMDDEMLDACQATIIKPHPNTYSYSKCLAEQLLSNFAGKFPIALGRPSIVVPAEKEPFPGWTDNINGPSGVIYAASRGVLHSMYCKSSIKIDSAPVDHTINGLILLAYTTGLEKPKDIRVCNLTMSDLKSVGWVETANFWRKYVKQYPLSYCLWYPVAKAKNYKIEHQIDAFFTHVLPAYFIDLILFLLGQKTFMVNVLNRLTHGLEVLEYYVSRNWNFKNDYFRSLANKITKEERDVFYTDLSLIDNEDYVKNYVKGIREFYCKEDPSTIPKAKKLQRRMYYLHLFTVYSVYAMCLYIIYRICIKIF